MHLTAGASSGRRLLDQIDQSTRKGIHAIIVHDSVPADCIEKEDRKEKKLKMKDSPYLRPLQR